MAPKRRFGVEMQLALPQLKRKTALWLSQGVAPRRLALTLALGFAIGCIPVVGIPTLLCATLALALRLNLPAIQLANYVAMPFQLLLIVPLVRLGEWMISAKPSHNLQPSALLHLPTLHVMTSLGVMAGEALLAWLLLAIPVVALLTFALTPMLVRIPALAAAEAAD